MSWFSWLGRPPKSRELQEAEAAFSSLELRDLQKEYQDTCAKQTGSARDKARRGLDGPQLAVLLGPSWRDLDPLLQSRLQMLVADRSSGRVHLEGLVIAKANLERLGEDTSLQFTFRLLDARDEGALSFEALRAGTLSCLRMTGALAPVSAAVPVPETAAAAASARGVAGAGAGAGAGADPGSASGREATPGTQAASVWATPVPTSPADVEAHVAAVCRGALAFAAGDWDGGSSPSAAAPDWAALRIPYDKYCLWCKRCPALHRTLCGLLRRVGCGSGSGGAVAAGLQHLDQGQGQGQQQTAAPGRGNGHTGPGGSALPLLMQLGKLPPDATLLRPVWTWALSSRLPAAQRSEWRLVFNSQRDGKSFNTFFARISAIPGPTLLLIRDAAGALFGGFASQPWAKSGTFFGDVASFIFSLQPTLKVFPATGINENYQWCGVGFSQLPGGLGFGGAAAGRGHFALYVEPSLDTGMSRPIATYGNCPLASEQLFQVATIECWLLQPPEDEDEVVAGRDASGHSNARMPGSSGSSGVLSRAEDRAFMQLAGMKMHSDGLKDEPLDEG